jgi:hypothetical protein
MEISLTADLVASFEADLHGSWKVVRAVDDTFLEPNS